MPPDTTNVVENSSSRNSITSSDAKESDLRQSDDEQDSEVTQAHSKGNAWFYSQIKELRKKNQQTEVSHEREIEHLNRAHDIALGLTKGRAENAVVEARKRVEVLEERCEFLSMKCKMLELELRKDSNSENITQKVDVKLTLGNIETLIHSIEKNIKLAIVAKESPMSWSPSNVEDRQKNVLRRAPSESSEKNIVRGHKLSSQQFLNYPTTTHRNTAKLEQHIKIIPRDANGESSLDKNTSPSNRVELALWKSLSASANQCISSDGNKSSENKITANQGRSGSRQVLVSYQPIPELSPVGVGSQNSALFEEASSSRMSSSSIWSALEVVKSREIESAEELRHVGQLISRMKAALQDAYKNDEVFIRGAMAFQCRVCGLCLMAEEFPKHLNECCIQEEFKRQGMSWNTIPTMFSGDEEHFFTEFSLRRRAQVLRDECYILDRLAINVSLESHKNDEKHAAYEIKLKKKGRSGDTSEIIVIQKRFQELVEFHKQCVFWVPDNNAEMISVATKSSPLKTSISRIENFDMCAEIERYLKVRPIVCL